MSKLQNSNFQLPFLQLVFEALTILTYCVALLPGAYLGVFYITIPLVIVTFVLSNIQFSELHKYSLINIFISILLLYFAYNSQYAISGKTAFSIINSLLAATGIAISVFAIMVISRDVTKIYKANQAFASHGIDKSKAEIIKPVFTAKKRKTGKTK